VFGDGQRCYPSPGLAQAAKFFKRGQGAREKIKNPQDFGWLTIVQHYLTYTSNPVPLLPHSCPPPKKFPPPPNRDPRKKKKLISGKRGTPQKKNKKKKKKKP